MWKQISVRLRQYGKVEKMYEVLRMIIMWPKVI